MSRHTIPAGHVAVAVLHARLPQTSKDAWPRSSMQLAGLSEDWYSVFSWASGREPSRGVHGVVWATVSLDFWRRAEAAVQAGARRDEAMQG